MEKAIEFRVIRANQGVIKGISSKKSSRRSYGTCEYAYTVFGICLMGISDFTSRGSAWDLFRGSLRLVRLGIEFERGRIDAIAQTCRGGAIVKHMPEMRVALRAQNFGSPHEKVAVFLGGDAGGIDGLPKRRPACAGIELCI
jgi:hypothetical protein